MGEFREDRHDDPIRCALVWNQESEPAPPFCLLEIRGYDRDTGRFLVGKPSVSGATALLVNGPSPMDAYDSTDPDVGEGQASLGLYVTAGWMNDGSADALEPVEGEEWGAKAGEWFLCRRYPGFRVAAIGDDPEYQTMIVQRPDASRVAVVEITGATPGGSVPATYYPADAVILDPTANTFSTTLEDVWYRELYGSATRTIGDRIPALLSGYGYGRPVFVGRAPTNYPPPSPVPADPSAVGCDGTGWAWLHALLEDECLLVTVPFSAGQCDDILTTWTAYMRWVDDRISVGVGAWVSQVWDTGTDAWVDYDFNGDAALGPLIFWVDAGRPRLQLETIGYDLGIICGSEADKVAVFSGGTLAVCAGTTPTDPCQDNKFLIQLACACCSVDGWGGANKWYVVVGAGEDCDVDTQTVVELLEEDRCDFAGVICDGPFDTEAEAEAALSRVVISCCSVDRPGGVANPLQANLSGGEGTMSLPYNGTHFTNSKALGCGETLHLRYNPATCGLDYSCNGTNWIAATHSLDPVDCGPPLSDGVWTCNMDDTNAGCSAGSCGSINVTIVEP